MKERELIKIDRNGTKHFRSWKCPHCDGKGSDRAWGATGYTCWKCNGTAEDSSAVRVTEKGK